MAYRQLLLVVLAVGGCTQEVPVFCNTNNDCGNDAYTCSQQHECVRNVDAGIPDLAGDMRGHDDAGDLGDAGERPDLTPMCTAQTVTTDCTNPAAPICGAGGMCRACTSSTDDPVCAGRSAATPHCDAMSGTCVACARSQDCMTATAPICDPITHTCRRCNSHVECPSYGMWPNLEATTGVCTAGGTCAPLSDVELVDNRGSVPSMCISNISPRNGSVAHPFCDIVETLPSPSPYVLVHGSSKSYNAISFPNTAALTTVLIGPGLTAPSPATIAQGSTNAPVINIASDTIHALDVTIDGFIIQGAGGTVDANGIDCTGTASNIGRTRLQLVRSIIQANAQLAINASSCDVNIDQTIIGPVSSTKNAAGGVTLAGCTYSIMNTLIHHNGDTGLASQALSLSGMGSATNKIVNCTIADNSSMTASVPAGVACGETTKPIMFNVALSGNSVGDQTLCTSLMTSAFPGGSVTNKDTSACTSADLFVAPTAAGGYNYAPRPSPTCMVTLTRAGAAAGAPTYDLFASPRPSPAGTNPDIGAVEGP